MKYSIRFYNGCRVLDKADEIIIKYTKKTASLIDFVKNKPEQQRIVIDITQLEDIKENEDIFAAAAKVHPNISLMMSYTQLPAPASIPFFFVEGAGDLDTLISFIQMGVSDIYIINELGFDLENVSKLCKEHKISIRVFPNVAQSTTSLPLDTLKKFFVRPEDIKLVYEDLIDTIEFFGPLDRQSILYQIYTDGYWHGNLKDLIIGLEEEINNDTIVPYFGTTRAKCKKRCIFDKCRVCNAISSLSDTLEEKGLGIKYEYKINENIMQNESAESTELSS